MSHRISVDLTERDRHADEGRRDLKGDGTQASSREARHLARAVTRTRPQYVATRLIINGADAADARATWLPITFLARLSFQRDLQPVSDYGRDYTSCWDLHEGSLAPPVMQWHTVMKGGLPPASPHRGAGIATTPYSPATPPTRDGRIRLLRRRQRLLLLLLAPPPPVMVILPPPKRRSPQLGARRRRPARRSARRKPSRSR